MQLHARVSLATLVVVSSLTAAVDAPAQVITRARVCANPPMVARYTFDDVMTDSSGSNNGAFAGSGTTFGAGRFGKALYFTNQTSATATITKASTPQWTTAEWLYETAPTYSDLATAGNACALFYGNDGVINASGFNWVGSYTRGGGMSTCPAAPTTSLMVENVTVKSAIGAWTHLATVFDGTVGHVYQDGVEVGTTGTFKFTGTSGAKAWTLGEVAGPYSAHTYIGAIDELRIYGVALTAQQIANLHAANDVNSPKDMCNVTANPIVRPSIAR